MKARGPRCAAMSQPDCAGPYPVNVRRHEGGIEPAVDWAVVCMHESDDRTDNLRPRSPQRQVMFQDDARLSASNSPRELQTRSDRVGLNDERMRVHGHDGQTVRASSKAPISKGPTRRTPSSPPRSRRRTWQRSPWCFRPASSRRTRAPRRPPECIPRAARP